MIKDPFDCKLNIELTLEELEHIIVCLRAINKYSTGSVRSELEERLDDISNNFKMSKELWV